MKKIFFFFTPFLFVLCFSFSAHAQAMPSISNDSLTLIDGGQSDLVSGRFLEYGMFPDDRSLVDSMFSYLLGDDVYLNPSDFTVRPLSDIEKENLENDFIRHFYDQNGYEIPINNLYYCSGDNGYLHAEFYMDSNGDVLIGDLDNSNYLINVGFSNDVFGQGNSAYANWDAVYSDCADRILAGNYNFYPGEIPDSDNTYFVWVGETAGGRPSKAGYILINNQNIPGTIVPINDTGQIYRWYTNDPSLITSVTTLGNFTPSTVSSGNFVYNGYTYRYLVTGIRGTLSMGTPINYDDWISGADRTSRIFGRQGVEYSSLSPSNDSVGFKKVVVPEMPIFYPDEMYDYNELQQLQPEAIPEANPDFDPTQRIRPGNFPFTYPLPDGLIIPSTLPLPGSNPNINPSPAPGDIIGDITPSTPIPTDIPILSNLQYRFPFSIPFDLYRLAKSFSAERLTPIFDLTFTIPIINYEVIISFDLTPWNGLFTLFRTLELVLFIGGLAVFSYEHFFGS